jgi:hypothetical protein
LVLGALDEEAVEDWEDEEVSLPVEFASLELCELVEEVERAAEAPNVGVLEIADVLARAAEGSDPLGPRRLPLNCGTSRAA